MSTIVSPDKILLNWDLGNCIRIWWLCRDNGKEHGNYYLGFRAWVPLKWIEYWGSNGIMGKNMETTM